MFKDTLQDPTAVGMSGQGEGLASEGLTDETIGLGVDTLQRSLQHMVSVLIFGALDHLAFELFDESVLLVDKDKFQRLHNMHHE